MDEVKFLPHSGPVCGDFIFSAYIEFVLMRCVLNARHGSSAPCRPCAWCDYRGGQLSLGLHEQVFRTSELWCEVSTQSNEMYLQALLIGCSPNCMWTCGTATDSACRPEAFKASSLSSRKSSRKSFSRSCSTSDLQNLLYQLVSRHRQPQPWKRLVESHARRSLFLLRDHS